MPKILIVDDEPTILNLLNKILTGQGYDITPPAMAKKRFSYWKVKRLI